MFSGGIGREYWSDWDSFFFRSSRSQMFLKIGPYKFRDIHKETTVLESLLIKLQA